MTAVAPPPTLEAIDLTVDPEVPADRPKRARLRRVVPVAATFVVFLAVWQGAHQLVSGQKRVLVPGPWTVLTKAILNGHTMGQIGSSLGLTTLLSLFGLAVAVILGLAVGLAMFRARWFEHASYPYLVALQAVPVLAITPALTLIFGYSFWAKSIIVVIIAFFPIPTTLLLGMKSTDRGLVDLFRLNGVGWRTTLLKLYLPNAIPSLVAGLRISSGLSVIGAIVGEQFFQQGSPGLGERIYAYTTNLQYPELYAAIIVSSLLGIVIFGCFGWAGQRVTRSWHESAGEQA